MWRRSGGTRGASTVAAVCRRGSDPRSGGCGRPVVAVRRPRTGAVGGGSQPTHCREAPGGEPLCGTGRLGPRGPTAWARRPAQDHGMSGGPHSTPGTGSRKGDPPRCGPLPNHRQPAHHLIIVIIVGCCADRCQLRRTRNAQQNQASKTRTPLMAPQRWPKGRNKWCWGFARPPPWAAITAMTARPSAVPQRTAHAKECVS